MDERKTLDQNEQAALPGEAQQLGTKAMKAFAHPLRMAMYSYLNNHGTATATTLAKHLGESTGQTSYHLRQLEKHGLVADDTGKGTGRERWWRATGFSTRELFKDPANQPALSAIMKHQLDERMTTIADWIRRLDDEPQEWIDASVDSSTTTTMNAEETHAMMVELMRVITAHTDEAAQRIKNSGESPGDRRVKLYLSVLPLEDSAPAEG